MKSLLLSSLLALAAAPAALAQSPATVKTKVKPAGQPSIKTKTTATKAKPAAAPAAEAPYTGPLPDDAVVTAKSNALTTNMQQNLGLSPQQTEKVRVINHRAVEQVETGHLRYKADPRKLAGVVESAGSSRLSAIKEVLTPAQFNKYQRKREEKMGVPSGTGVQGNAAPGLGGGGGGDQ